MTILTKDSLIRTENGLLYISQLTTNGGRLGWNRHKDNEILKTNLKPEPVKRIWKENIDSLQRIILSNGFSITGISITVLTRRGFIKLEDLDLTKDKVACFIHDVSNIPISITKENAFFYIFGCLIYSGKSSRGFLSMHVSTKHVDNLINIMTKANILVHCTDYNSLYKMITYKLKDNKTFWKNLNCLFDNEVYINSSILEANNNQLQALKMGFEDGHYESSNIKKGVFHRIFANTLLTLLLSVNTPCKIIRDINNGLYNIVKEKINPIPYGINHVTWLDIIEIKTVFGLDTSVLGIENINHFVGPLLVEGLKEK